MTINALLHTSNYRGDHAADIAIAIEPTLGETVTEFVARILSRPEDHIELRVVRGGDQS